MAKAITHREVSVTLELNEDEAILLRDLMDSIGGPQSSRRGISDGIKKALESAGITASHMGDMDPERQVIYFNESIKTFI